jgi:hypothetical protein
MSLDINTPRGQESVHEEDRMLAIIKQSYPSLQFFHTPIKRSALIDGFIVKDNELRALFESKCRRESLQSFSEPPLNNEWMISQHKLNSAATIAKHLSVPFCGFLYLVNDNRVLMFKLTDETGRFIHPMRVERRKTSASCNGGTMIDTCYFINLKYAIYVN